MKFKKPEIEAELAAAPLFLRLMAQSFDAESMAFCGQEAIATRVLEPVPGESGVHTDHRAIDFRSEFEGGRLYTEEQVKHLVNFMNTTWYRNDGKVTCLHHSFDGGPMHFHIQLSTLTKVYMPYVQSTPKPTIPTPASSQEPANK